MKRGTRPHCFWRRAALWSGVSAVLLLALAAYARKHRPTPAAAPVIDDPRLTFATPFRNVRPDVAYVGDAACVDCHRDVSDAYRHHPMGKSFAPVSAADLQETAGAPSFQKFGSTFVVQRRGDQLDHSEVRRDDAGRPAAELSLPVRYTLGSGRRGKSYLVDLDGYLFQSPIGWFAQKNGWDISPGYGADTHFGRAVGVGCLVCHCNDAAPVADTLNRYRTPAFRQHAIGCERCHGPGALHVRERADGVAAGDLDDTIVNPTHLEPALREAVCWQCHLQGETRVVRRGRDVFDYRPGLPLDLFWSVFVRRPDLADDHKAVGQVEQTAESGCFRGSGGALGCTSCHDPHRVPEPAGKVAYYRGRCLKCHDRRGCSLPQAERRAKADDCAGCHMPRLASADIAHTAISDHRILRRPEVPRGDPRVRREGGLPIVSFFGAEGAAGREDVARDLGVALVHLALNRGRGGNQGRALATAARPLLDRALQTRADDVPAWVAKGNALHMSGLRYDALAAFEEALARAPERETALSGAALTAEELQNSEAAISYWRRLLAVDPHSATGHARLATLLGADGRWAEALREGREVLRLNPFAVEARVFVAQCLIRLGELSKAREEFGRVEALKPPDLDELRQWFDKLTAAARP